MFSPAVITSKAAQDHINDIKTRHNEILQGMAVQDLKVKEYNANQAALMNESEEKSLKQKEMSMKEEELAIKRQALTI